MSDATILKTGIQKSVAQMTPNERMVAAADRAASQLGPEVGAKLKSFINLETAGVLATTAGLWAAAQFTPIGWVADIATIGLGALAIGGAFMLGYDLGGGLKNLIDYVTTARNAKTDQDLDAAADHLAKGVATLGVDTVGAIVLHKVAGKVAEKLGPKAAAENIAKTKSGLPDEAPPACIECEKAAAQKAAESGKPDEYLYRKDDYAHNPEFPEEHPKAGKAKSHITEDGSVRPANPDGQATIQDHITGRYPEKGDSPYTSFSDQLGTEKSFGDKTITIDKAKLREDIASGKVQDVQIIENDELMAMHEQNISEAKARYNQELTRANKNALTQAERNATNSLRDKEVLVKGEIPAEYIVSKPPR